MNRCFKMIVALLFLMNSGLLFSIEIKRDTLKSSGNSSKDSVWLFVSFKDPGDSGIWYALSKDGKVWHPANNNKPVLVPDLSKGKMRDPYIVRGAENDFHLLWTSGKGRIGHAVSTDLVHWSEQQIIPILPNEPRVQNTWAPEMLFDSINGNWLVFWSSTLAGDFPETNGQVENGKNHRIYSLTTTDFKTFTEPRLFFDPGYPVIDATILPDGNRYLMVFKDERRWPLFKLLRTAVSNSLNGPWTEISEPITDNWTEGPTLIKAGDKYTIYYDRYSDPQGMEAIQSVDFKNWSQAPNGFVFPKLYKHGCFFKISANEALKIKELEK